MEKLLQMGHMRSMLLGYTYEGKLQSHEAGSCDLLDLLRDSLEAI